MADDIARLGYEIDSSQARAAAADLDKLAGASDRVAASADGVRMSNNGISAQYKSQAMSAKQLKAAQDALAGATNRYGKSAQAASQHSTNLLFQFQDIGMMLAAGQNPLMLAMQQGTQVAGVLHQMKASGQSAFSGIKAGLLGLISPTSLLTIGIIAGGAALVQWGISAFGAGEDADRFADRLKAVREQLVDTEFQLKAMRAGVTEDEYTLIRNVVAARQKLAKIEEMAVGARAATMSRDMRLAQENLANAEKELEKHRAISAEIKLRQERQKRITEQQETHIRQMAELFLMAQEVNTEFEVRMRQADEMAKLNSIELMFGSQSIEYLKQKQAAERASLEDRIKAAGYNQQMADQLRRALEYEQSIERGIQSSANATSEWEERMARVRVELAAIAAFISSLGGGAITAAAKRTEIAALRAGQSVKEAARASSEFSENLKLDAQAQDLERRFGVIGKAMGGLLKGQAQYNRELDRTLEAERELAIEREKEAARSGGAGGADDGKLQGLISSLMTERETLEVWRTEQLALLAQYNDAELAAIGGKNAAKLRLEKEYQERLAEVQKSENQARMAGYQTLFGDMASLMQSGNEKLFRIGQAAAIANATVDGWEAATAAWKWGMSAGGPGLAAIAAGASLARTAMMISNIASQSPNGSGSSGGGGGGGAPTQGAAAPQQPERIVRVNLQGDKWMKDLAEGMLSQIYEATEDGARVVIAR